MGSHFTNAPGHSIAGGKPAAAYKTHLSHALSKTRAAPAFQPVAHLQVTGQFLSTTLSALRGAPAVSTSVTCACCDDFETTSSGSGGSCSSSEAGSTPRFIRATEPPEPTTTAGQASTACSHFGTAWGSTTSTETYSPPARLRVWGYAPRENTELSGPLGVYAGTVRHL